MTICDKFTHLNLSDSLTWIQIKYGYWQTIQPITPDIQIYSIHGRNVRRCSYQAAGNVTDC